MSSGIYKRTDEHKRKLSIGQKSRSPMSEEIRAILSKKQSVRNMGNKYNLGKHLSEGTRKKIGLTQMGNTKGRGNLGKHPSEETKKKMSMAKTGTHPSEETRKRMSVAMKNRKPMSEETKKKISLSHIGRPSPLKGKSRLAEIGRKISLAKMGHAVSEETRNKLSVSMIGSHHNWRGGISFEPYTLDWTRTLKRSIRERDKYTCRLCGKTQGDIAFCVHHIDYDKKNCNPNNLVTLCIKCHTGTNGNRDYWSNYFKTRGGEY